MGEIRSILPPEFRDTKKEYKAQTRVSPYIDYVIEALRPHFGPGRGDVIRTMLHEWIQLKAETLREMNIPVPARTHIPEVVLQASFDGTDS